jgi:hypothetical protein
MKKNQYGFAAVEAVIIVVVLAVVAGLGWYVYKSNQKDDKKTTTSQNDSDTADTKNPGTNQESDVKDGNYVTISAWGVRAPYEGEQKLTYKLSDDKRIAYFGSEQLTALDAACSTARGGGMIQRFASSDRTWVDGSGPTAEEAAKTDSSYQKVGNYYYHFTHEQSGCGDTDKTAALQQQVNDLVKTLTSKLVTTP